MAGDSTQFLIDISAKLTGGDTSIAQLATLGDKMLAAGSSAVELEKTTEKMTAALEAQKTAVEQSNAALAKGEQSYKQAEIAADRAAKALEKLRAGADPFTPMTKRQAEAAEKAKIAAMALKLEAAALDDLKSKSNAAKATQDALSKGLKNVETAAVKAAEAEGSGKLNEISAGLAKIGGPLDAAGQKVIGFAEGFKKLGASLGAAGPYVAIAVAIVAIGTAAATAAIAITKWGIAMADANRTQTMLAAGIARSVKGGEQLEAEVDKISRVVPLSNEELFSMASNLSSAGLRGQDLTNALEQTALTAAKLKFGPDFQKQLLSLDSQVARFHSNVSNTFGGLKIEGLLEGFSKLVGLFDASTESGKTLKFLFEALFQPLVDGAAGAAVKVERFFIQAENLALRAFIALKPYSDQLQEIGRLFLIGAGVIGGAFLAALVLVAATLAEIVVYIGAIVEGLVKIGAWVAKLAKAGFGDLADMGSLLMDGLVGGIKSKDPAVQKAMTDSVTTGVDKMNDILQMGSPSKLMFEMGENTAAGYAGGVDAGAGETQSALENMVAMPTTGAAPAAGGAAQGSTYNITVNVDGRGEDDEGLAQKIANAIRNVFESDALSLGAGEVPA